MSFFTYNSTSGLFLKWSYLSFGTGIGVSIGVGIGVGIGTNL